MFCSQDPLEREDDASEGTCEFNQGNFPGNRGVGTRPEVHRGGRQARERVFDMARERSPSIIFIDEIDAIGSKRLDSTTSGDREVHRTLMQLLSEMDGFSSSEGISVIAATNRMELLDKALLRPGRFDRIISISSPDKDGVKDILEIHTAKVPLAKDVDLGKIAKNCEGFSGAEIKAVVTEAAMSAISSGGNRYLGQISRRGSLGY